MDKIAEVTNIAPVCIEELGVSQEVERALRQAGITNFGQLESKENLEQRGLSEKYIGDICIALHQYGTVLPNC